MENKNIPTSLSEVPRYADGYYQSRAGGQFYQRRGDWVQVVCVHDFNYCVERMRFPAHFFHSLDVSPCPAEAFMAARLLAIEKTAEFPHE